MHNDFDENIYIPGTAADDSSVFDPACRGSRSIPVEDTEIVEREEYVPSEESDFPEAEIFPAFGETPGDQ